MRTVVGVALVTICLGLAGCSLFGKKNAARNKNPKPFLGSETAAVDRRDPGPANPLTRDSDGPLPGANGVLAGRVVVEATDQPIKASILLKNIDGKDDKKADLDLSTDDSGYFTFSNLNVGKSYQLIARAIDHGELISGTAWVKPPNPIILIRLDKRWTTASTPPPPDMPNLPGKKSTAETERAQQHKPAVSIDPPVKLPEQEPSPRGGIAGPPANPANIADGGFRRLAPPAETINIPPPPPPPSQPQWENVPEQRPLSPSFPPQNGGGLGGAGSVRMPNIPTPVPSCGLYGNRLDNFALYDQNGETWEYKRDRRGRLMLLDFWHSTCGSCLHCIPHLVELQRDFGSVGLEVIGIACETGTLEEQRSHVRAIRGRYNINYRTLLSGGPSCPVVAQFQVTFYPLLVLIDADGTILWRSTREGMDDYKYYALRKRINDRLVTRQSPP